MTEYKNTIEQEWNLYKKQFELSSQKGKELTRIASVIRLYARQVVRYEELLKNFTKAVESKDVSSLRNIKNLAARMQEEKAYYENWKIVSKEYDELVETVKASSETNYYKNSTEILADALDFYNEQREAELLELKGELNK